MIEITHTPDQGTVARGVPRVGAPAEILRAADWAWSSHLEAWHVAGSRHQAMSIWHVDEVAEALRQAGFDVSVRADDERTQRRHALRLVNDQITHLEGKLSKVDRLLDEHFRSIAVGARTSTATDLWTIRMLIRRIDLDERLRRWREVGDRRVAGRPAGGATTTQSPPAGRPPYHDITHQAPADGPDGPLP
ncbi:hypothetical protein AB0L64_39860 [Kribbella sp. NPDC051936]|uniref:hypothetical protein n=1 Tax=Kribbella sp. NPDC051936 TaxID=3154946 RepID=UPI003443C3FA